MGEWGTLFAIDIGRPSSYVKQKKVKYTKTKSLVNQFIGERARGKIKHKKQLGNNNDDGDDDGSESFS